MFSKIALIITAALMLFACSADSSKPKADWSVHSIHCYIRYVEQAKQLQAEVLFKNQHAQGLSIEGNVQLNGKNMRATTLPKIGIRYQCTIETDQAPRDCYLKFVNGAKHDVQQRLPFPQFKSLSFPTDGFSKSAGGSIQWKGAICGKQDILLLRLTDSQGTTYRYNHLTGTRGTQYDIIPPSLASITLGKAVLAVTFRRKAQLKIGAIALDLVTEHYTKEHKVQIVE